MDLMDRYLNSTPPQSPQSTSTALVSLAQLEQTQLQRRGSITDPYLHASPKPAAAAPKPKRKSRKTAADGSAPSGSRAKSKRAAAAAAAAEPQFAIPVPGPYHSSSSAPPQGMKRKLSGDSNDEDEGPDPKRRDSGEDHNPDEQVPPPQGEWWPGRDHPPPMFGGYPPHPGFPIDPNRPPMMAYWPPGVHPEDPRYMHPGGMPMAIMEHPPMHHPPPGEGGEHQDEGVNDLDPSPPGGTAQNPTKDGAPYSRSPELRVSHKLAERKRRNDMKTMFEDLQRALPVDHGMKASKWELMNKAIDYMNNMRATNENLTREVEMLRHELEQRGGPSAYPPGVVFTSGPPPPGYIAATPQQLLHMQGGHHPHPGPPPNGAPSNGSEGTDSMEQA